jgi:hypothetical protein
MCSPSMMLAVGSLVARSCYSRGEVGAKIEKTRPPPHDLLMTNTKLHRHLQSIGCFATIIAIGFGPSLQNLIHYYPNTVVNPAQQAYITNSSSYTSVGPLRGGSRETREIPLID